MAEQQSLGGQLSDHTDAGLPPQVPRNASVTSLHSMGGDPIWNTTHVEIDALNHWRPEQAMTLPDEQHQQQHSQVVALTSQQAAALAAFRDVPADRAQSGGATNPAEAGAEIAAIMQRPPAVDPTTLPLPLPQQPDDHSKVSSGAGAGQFATGGSMQQLGGQGAFGSDGNLQLLGSQSNLQRQQQLGSHDDLVQLGSARLGPIGSSSNLRQLGSHSNLQQLGSSGVGGTAGGRTSSLFGSHCNLQQLGSHSNLQQLGSVGSPAPLIGSSSNLKQLGDRGGDLLGAGGSALALSASDVGPLAGSSGLLRAMGSAGKLAAGAAAAGPLPTGVLDGGQGRMPPHSVLQPPGHRHQGGHSTDGSHLSSHGSYSSGTAAPGHPQQGLPYGPGSALLPSTVSHPPRPASGGVVNDDDSFPWARLDKNLLQCWVMQGRCPPPDDQHAAPDAIYAELQEADQVTRHLWIGGLAPGVDRATLINVAQAFGPLQDVTMVEGTPIAFVSFANVQPACRAFELLDGQQVPVLSRQHPLSVKFRPAVRNARLLRPGSANSSGHRSEGDAAHTPSARLWLGNISNQATAASVRAAFESFGPVIDAAAFPARIGPLGYAIVVFERVEDAVRAVAAKNNRPDPLLTGSRPLKMRYKPDKGQQRRSSPGHPLQHGGPAPMLLRRDGSPQPAPSRHLALGNLLPAVTRTAIELAFSQYGSLEEVRASAGHASEVHILFRDLQGAIAAQRALNGAFIPSLTGSKPLAVHFVSDRASPGPSGLHHQQPGGPPRAAGDSWRAGIPRPELSASDDSSDDAAMPAVNLSNRLNPNNIHYDRVLAAQYKRMSKPEKEALWAQDRLMQQRIAQSQGGDLTAPLRSSLAGLRMGEPGAYAANANRAFSHADLHSLSGAYGDLNPYSSNPDLASLAQAALGNPQLAASALQGGLGGSGLARQFPQFASHPDLSSQLLQQQALQQQAQLQQQVHLRALQQAAQAQLQMQQAAAAQAHQHQSLPASAFDAASSQAALLNSLGQRGSRGDLTSSHPNLPTALGGSSAALQQAALASSVMNRSASAPHVNRLQHGLPHSSRLGRGQQPSSHASLSTLAENGDGVTQWPQQPQMGAAYPASQQQFGSGASLSQDLPMRNSSQDTSGGVSGTDMEATVAQAVQAAFEDLARQQQAEAVQREYYSGQRF